MTRRWTVVAGVAGVAALAATLWLALDRRDLTGPPPSRQELESLRATRDALEERLRRGLVAAGETSLSEAPEGDLMIGIPTALATSLLEQAVTGLFAQTEIVLEDVHAQAEGAVEADVLFKKRTVGDYVLDVRIHTLRGILRPSVPQIRFAEGRIQAVLPVRLTGGEGKADLRLQWDSKGLVANVVCGDVDVTRRVSGRVLPADYRLQGEFTLEASGGAIVFRPGRLTRAVRLSIAPSAQALEALNEVIDEQRKGCEIALGKADVPAKLTELLARGFEVDIPRRLLEPVPLPIGAVSEVEYQGSRFALQVTPTGVLLAPDRLWYAADIALSDESTKR